MPIPNLQAQARKTQALAFVQSNQLQQAKLLYEEICRSDKLDVEAWLMLGVVNGQMGDYADAESCFRKVIALKPRHVEAHTKLGILLAQQGHVDEAIACMRQALQITPGQPQLLHRMAMLFAQQGKRRKAENYFRRASVLAPEDAQIHYDLGCLLSKNDHRYHKETIQCFQQALEINPVYIEALIQLAVAHTKYGYPAIAVDCYQKLRDINPDNAAVHSALGYALKLHDKPDDAIRSFQVALRLNPNFPGAAAGMASVLEQQGDEQAAYESIQPFLDSGSMSPNIAISFGRLCKKLGREKEASMHMEKLLLEGDLTPVIRENVHFALGKLYDSQANYKQAFRHFQQGNKIIPSTKDMLAHAKQVSSLMSSYSSDHLQQLPQAKDHSQLPVFIVGMPRSGTSLVEQILACHPQIFGAGELINIFDMVESLPELLGVGRTYPDCIVQLSQEMMGKLSRPYLNSLKEKAPNAKRVTNKMPANYWHLGFIQMAFPGARIIHCARDPLDTCLSCYFQNFGSRHIYSRDLTQLGEYSLQYQRMMHHWKSVLKISMMEVCYEDLVADQEAVSRAMIEFCGLEWDAKCLHYFESRRVINTVSYDQVREPMYATSVGRWKNYEAYLDPLIKALTLFSAKYR